MLKMRTNGVWKAISDEGISREKKWKKKEAGKKKEQKREVQRLGLTHLRRKDSTKNRMNGL